MKMIGQLVDMSKIELKDEFLESLNLIDDPYYRFLYHLARYYKPEIAIEIGTYQGVGAAHMAAGGAGYTIGIDINRSPWWIKIKNRIDNIEFIRGEADQVAQGLVEYEGRVGLVFQDSSHHYLASKREWDAFQPLLAPDSIWVCDDITPAFCDPLIDPPGKGMIQYFNELPGNKWLFSDLHLGSVIGVIRQ